MTLPKQYEQNKIALNSTYILFYAGISAYKIYYSLWMEQEDKIYYFTISQCALWSAIIISSLLLTRINSKYNSILLCSTIFLAGFGIYLSSFSSNILYPIIGGFLTGIGICVVFHTINSLMKALIANNNFLYSGILNNLGRLSGIALVTSYIYLSQYSSLQMSLYLGAALILMSILPMLFADKTEINSISIHTKRSPISWKEFMAIYSSQRETVGFLLLINFLFSLSTNILTPYFSIILYKNEEGMFMIGLTIILGGIVTNLVQNFLVNNPIYRNFSSEFLRSCFYLMAFTLVIYYYNIYSNPAAVVMLSLLVAVTVAMKRFIENKMMSRRISSEFWYLSALISMMLGNIGGAIIGGCLLYNKMIDLMFLVSAFFMFAIMVTSSVYTSKLIDNSEKKEERL